jgi:two-component system response regulator YesN
LAANWNPTTPNLKLKDETPVLVIHSVFNKPKFIEMKTWQRVQYYSCTRKAVDYLQKSFSMPIGLQDIAGIACMEKTSFSRAFKQKTGITLRDFIQAYRISLAVTRIEESDCSITEVAFSVGFSSLDTFERVFKKIAGTTPSRYRMEILRKMA